MDQALAPALLTLSLVSGSIRSRRIGPVGEAMLLASCVASGALGIAGLIG